MTPTVKDLHAIFASQHNHAVDWSDFHETSELLAQVADELEAQDVKWGQQDHPMIVSPYASHRADIGGFSQAYYRRMADAWKVINARRAEAGCLAWDGILLEEVFEALAEADLDNAVIELIQTAAVAVQAAKTIRRLDSLDGAA